MKYSSSAWLLEVGTREGNRVVFSRPYVPASCTDIRRTFERINKQMQPEHKAASSNLLNRSAS